MGNPPNLPLDVYPQIFTYLPQKTIKNCRLLSRALTPAATSLTFSHLYLSAYDPDSPAKFAKIAQSPRLRSLVTEITVDTWVGPDYEYGSDQGYPFPLEFFRALSYLRVFSETRTLNLRFSRWCSDDIDEEEEDDGPGNSCGEEDPVFRGRVLDTVFKCAAGTWNETEQMLWLSIIAEYSTDSKDASEHDSDMAVDPNEFPPEHMEANRTIGYVYSGMPVLKTLTISHLAADNDRALVKSEAFKKVMHSPSLTELKLLITVATDDDEPESTLALPKKYEFFRTLNETWLSPPVARKLEVLTLYCNEHWGWAPRVEFRGVNPGTGPDDPTAGFPKLRVLALGNYIFSHDWQIDWISSLGKRNEHGALQELHLDECLLLWHAQCQKPLARGMMKIKYNSEDSKSSSSFEVPNKGYPRTDVLTGRYEGWANDGEYESQSWNTRWSDILDKWYDSMPGLQLFKMGRGCWNNELAFMTMTANSFPEEWSRFNYNKGRHQAVESDAGSEVSVEESASVIEEHKALDREFLIREHRCAHCVHINYDRPVLLLYGAFGHGIPFTKASGADKDLLLDEMMAKKSISFKFGGGMSQTRRDILQYIKFDHEVGPPWLPDYYMKPKPHSGLYDDDDSDDDPLAGCESEIEDDWIKMPEYEEVMRRDEEALERFKTKLTERNKSK